MATQALKQKLLAGATIVASLNGREVVLTAADLIKISACETHLQIDTF